MIKNTYNNKNINLNKLKNKLLKKYIKKYGFKRKIVLDHEINQFFKSPNFFKNLNTLDSILKMALKQISLKHRNNKSYYLNEYKNNTKLLDQTHKKHKSLYKDNFNKDILNYTNEEWDSICQKNHKSYWFDMEYQKLKKNKDKEDYKNILDLQTGKISLEKSNYTIKKDIKKPIKIFKQKSIKNILKEQKQENIKELEIKKEKIKETIRKRKISLDLRNKKKSNYISQFRNKIKVNTENISNTLKSTLNISKKSKHIKDRANKTQIKSPKELKYYTNPYKNKKDLKFSNFYKKKIQDNNFFQNLDFNHKKYDKMYYNKVGFFIFKKF